jgi:hypothetical protein
LKPTVKSFFVTKIYHPFPKYPLESHDLHLCFGGGSFSRSRRIAALPPRCLRCSTHSVADLGQISTHVQALFMPLGGGGRKEATSHSVAHLIFGWITWKAGPGCEHHESCLRAVHSEGQVRLSGLRAASAARSTGNHTSSSLRPVRGRASRSSLPGPIRKSSNWIMQWSIGFRSW